MKENLTEALEIVQAMMDKQRYPDVKIMIEESLVRVIAVFCTHARLGQDAASKLMHTDVGHGFLWNMDLAKWFGVQRPPWDLEAMVPDIASFFSAEAAKGVGASAAPPA